MTVGELRKALDGVSADLLVTVRMWTDEDNAELGSLDSAQVAPDCDPDEEVHFILEGHT